jgi:hypothetical protein
MDDDGYLLVPLLCSYLHTARRSLAFRFSALGDRSIAFVGFCVFSQVQFQALQILGGQGTRSFSAWTALLFFPASSFAFPLYKWGVFPLSIVLRLAKREE